MRSTPPTSTGGCREAQRPRGTRRRHHVRRGDRVGARGGPGGAAVRADRARGTRGDDRGGRPGARGPAQLLRPRDAGRAAGALGTELDVPRRPRGPGVRADADPAGPGRGGGRRTAGLPVRLDRRDARPARRAEDPPVEGDPGRPRGYPAGVVPYLKWDKSAVRRPMPWRRSASSTGTSISAIGTARYHTPARTSATTLSMTPSEYSPISGTTRELPRDCRLIAASSPNAPSDMASVPAAQIRKMTVSRVVTTTPSWGGRAGQCQPG